MGASDIFGGKTRWASYEAELHVDTLVGGIPKDPDTIRKWLTARLDMHDAEIQAIVDETLETMGVEALTSENLEELLDTVVAKDVKGNGFKRYDSELVWEGRQAKAALRESANATYPGIEAWPGKPDKSKKGLKSWLDERVEVADRYIPLGRSEPDVVGEQRIKHVTIPGQGKRSTINVVDVCFDVKMTWHLKVLDDCIPAKLWQELFEYIEWGGIGADRARGDGRCQLIAWRRTE